MATTTTLQLTNNEVIVLADLQANVKQSTLRFEYDDTVGAYLAVGGGNNQNPVRLTNVGSAVWPRAHARPRAQRPRP